MAMIKERIARINEDMASICRSSGRNPNDITIVAVTKFANVSQIEEALSCGIIHIGENKVQQALEKFSFVGAHGPACPAGRRAPLQGQKIVKHMIGHLQTNKVRDALKIFDIIESVDSLKLARAIDAESRKQNRIFDILIQVNISGEAQKFGVAEDEALQLIEDAAHLQNIHIKGLMTIAPMTEDESIVRDVFRKLRELRDRVKKDFAGAKNISMDSLSMGMTNDYRIAIEEGSNMVRIGRAIFT